VFRDLKIKTKIFITFFIASLILIGIGISIFYYFSTNFIRTAVYNHLETVVQSRANNIKMLLEEEKKLVRELALIGKVERLLLADEADLDYGDNVAAVNERLQKTVDSIDEIVHVSITDKSGKIIVSTNRAVINQDKSNEAYFLTAKQGTIAIGRVHFTPGNGKFVFTMAAPVINNDEILGVVLMISDLEKSLFHITLDKTGIGKTGETYLINSESYAITPLLFVEDAILERKVDTINSRNCLEMFEVEERKEHVGHEAVETFLDYMGEKVIGTHYSIPEVKWCLLAEINEEEALAPLGWIFWIAIGIALFLFFPVYLIAYWVSKKISKPITDLRQGVEIVGEGNLDHKVEIKSKDEVGLLSRAFDKMVANLKEAKKDVYKKVEEQTKLIRGQKEKLEKQQGTLLTSLKDVQTERERVARERDKVSAILHSIGDGVFVIDKDFKITVFNQAAVDISGFSKKEVIGKKYGEVLKFVFENSGKVNDGFIKKAMNTGEVKELSNHAVLIRKDGKKIAVADSAAPLRNENGKIVGCVVVFRDVSRERRISQMESEFVSIASHQLRTPITAIQWLMELILKKEKISKKGREYLDDVHASAIRLNALVDLLLNVSKVEAGKISVSFREIEVIKTIERYLKESKGLFAKKNIILTFKEHPKALNVITDNNLFRNILQSLVSNAIDYTLEKGKIEVSLEKKPKSFVLVVSDTGIGIPEKEQATIFDKFTRASNAKLVKTDGTGLGLYFTKQIVGLLGGKIWLKSAKDKGATFYVELPLNSKTKVKNTNSN